MVGDIICRIGNILFNVADISLLEKVSDEIRSNIKMEAMNDFDNYECEILIRVIFKSGKEKFIGLSKKEYDNLIEYYNAVCPDLMDDFTRKTMVQHIFNQRNMAVKRMMDDGQIPRSDFPSQMQNRGGPGVKP
jgi:hypothetical protein